MAAMTVEAVMNLPVAFSLDVAGSAWGFGRSKTRELHAAGEFPVQVRRLGGSWIATKADLLASLGIPWDAHQIRGEVTMNNTETTAAEAAAETAEAKSADAGDSTDDGDTDDGE